MITISLHDAQANLGELVEKAARGESFIISRAGKSLVKVAAVDPSTSNGKQRVGFMKGQFSVPDDFDSMGEEELADLFQGRS